MTPGRSKALAWVLMAIGGAAGLALASRSGDQQAVVRALGWSVVAATGASLLLGTLGRRLVAVLVLMLGVGLVLVARGPGHAGLWAAGGLVVAGAVLQFLVAPAWATSARRYRRGTDPNRVPTTDVDVWKAMDAGLDPTDEGFGGSLAGRRTSTAVHQEER